MNILLESNYFWNIFIKIVSLLVFLPSSDRIYNKSGKISVGWINYLLGQKKRDEAMKMFTFFIDFTQKRTKKEPRKNTNDIRNMQILYSFYKGTYLYFKNTNLPLKSTSPLPSASKISITRWTNGFCCNSGSDMNSSILRAPELSKSNFLNLFPSRRISSASTKIQIGLIIIALIFDWGVITYN